jgi:hypothetical protein
LTEPLVPANIMPQYGCTDKWWASPIYRGKVPSVLDIFWLVWYTRRGADEHYMMNTTYR